MRLIATFALCTALLSAQDQWKSLRFLEGTWEAKTQSETGTYTFAEELGGHILARHSSAAGDHGDLLYIYREAPGQPLKAIYFDNEGHVIHYTVATPTPDSVVFESEQYRLLYERKGKIMSGKFQIRMPGKPNGPLTWNGPDPKNNRVGQVV